MRKHRVVAIRRPRKGKGILSTLGKTYLGYKAFQGAKNVYGRVKQTGNKAKEIIKHKYNPTRYPPPPSNKQNNEVSKILKTQLDPNPLTKTRQKYVGLTPTERKLKPFVEDFYGKKKTFSATDSKLHRVEGKLYNMVAKKKHTPNLTKELYAIKKEIKPTAPKMTHESMTKRVIPKGVRDNVTTIVKRPAKAIPGRDYIKSAATNMSKYFARDFHNAADTSLKNPVKSGEDIFYDAE